jgi:HK97 family phage major capsid protein
MTHLPFHQNTYLGVFQTGCRPTRQASVFSAPFTIADENPLDKILLAILQAQMQSKLPVDGVVMDPLTWGELISLKDGEQRYLAGAAGGPFGAIASRIWQVPVVTCETLARGEVLVGAFRLGAKIFDRLQMEVLISTESGDNFKTNMVTVRAEERLALAVRVPDAFVFIDELGQGFSSGA